MRCVAIQYLYCTVSVSSLVRDCLVLHCTDAMEWNGSAWNGMSCHIMECILQQIHGMAWHGWMTWPFNEALRGFDAPMVFNQGVRASLAEVADQEVPGEKTSM